MVMPRLSMWLRVMRRIFQLLRGSVHGNASGPERAVPWRWLVIAGLLLGTLPAHAIDYVFPGNLPLGCVDNSGGNYRCPGMTLAAGDNFTIAAPKPVTITFSSAVTAGAGVRLNADGAASDLMLIVNGSFVIDTSSTLNGSVTTIGAGYVTAGAGSTVVGSISTQAGYVTLGANSRMQGNITTVSGYVVLGAGSNITGSIITQENGYVTMGAGSTVSGAIAIKDEGYVFMGDSASVSGNIDAANGYVTLDANGVVGGQIYSMGAGVITLGANSDVHAVCCKSTDGSCLINNSGKPTPPICIGAESANFDCLETGAVYNNVTGNPGLRNPLFTKLVGTPFTFDVAAIKPDGTRATTYASGSAGIKVELVDGAGTTACASRAAAVPAISQMLTLARADSGLKTVTVNVGRAYTELRCRVTDANVSPPVVGCSSDSFSVRPTAPTLTMSAATAPSARAMPVITAGASFDLGAATQTGSGYGGILMLDTSKLTAQIPAQDTTVQGGGVVGALTPLVLVANAASATARYTEVGYLYLAPGAFRDDLHTLADSNRGDCITDTTDDRYLSDTLINGKYGCSVGNRVPSSLGRFVPDHFDVSLPALTASCAVGTPFSYFGQDGFTTAFTVTARNSGGATTQNYAGAFARFDLSSYAGYFFSAAPLPVGSTLASGATAPAGTWGQGVARVSVRHQVSRPTAPTPDTVVAVSARLSDGETVASAITVVGDSVRLRYGRLQMKNAYGSEMLSLPVPLEAQYWAAGGYYVTNTDDSCTVIPPASIVMGNFQKQLRACDTQLSAAGGSTLQSGRLPGAGLVLSRPGPGKIGSFDLQLNLTTAASGNTCVNAAGSSALAGRMPWFGASPQAQVTFGIYKSRLVYSRENY